MGGKTQFVAFSALEEGGRGTAGAAGDCGGHMMHGPFTVPGNDKITKRKWIKLSAYKISNLQKIHMGN